MKPGPVFRGRRPGRPPRMAPTTAGQRVPGGQVSPQSKPPQPRWRGSAPGPLHPIARSTGGFLCARYYRFPGLGTLKPTVRFLRGEQPGEPRSSLPPVADPGRVETPARRTLRARGGSVLRPDCRSERQSVLRRGSLTLQPSLAVDYIRHDTRSGGARRLDLWTAAWKENLEA